MYFFKITYCLVANWSLKNPNHFHDQKLNYSTVTHKRCLKRYDSKHGVDFGWFSGTEKEYWVKLRKTELLNIKKCHAKRT